MDKTELQQKLSQPFDPTRWKEVVESIFPGSQYYSQDRDIPSGEEIVERFAEKGFIRLADGKNLALVELRLKKGSVQLPKNRVKLRGLVAGLIDQERAHGVIAVFEQGGDDYRLSFVAKEAVIEDGEFKTRETPAKRYTYLLGPGETCRTAAERLHVLGQKKELQLADVTDAFNVEKLNKQFFKDYQAQYERFCAFLASPENSYRKAVFGIPANTESKEEKPIRDFVKRLLGRLVFLQFLQKKGWMGCPANSHHWTNGDRHFLQSFFSGCTDQEHFHSAFLTPLFYDALNRENRAGDIFELTGSRIPYLNGGLFEDDLPATRAIDFPPDYFGGLLDCFGAYNFTIDENDPMDAEVGIDPEMLGHIFENLLEDNKDKGAYYTPKAIVHYMCQESLLQYLKTGFGLTTEGSEDAGFSELEVWIRSPDKTVPDDRGNFVRKNARRIEALLDAVKICDPAIGSGAFPMGLLQEIYRCKINLDLTLEPAEVKRGIIQNSIYGVDIEKGAVDIARLRFWLSLVVDEEAPSPLPNLDFKIMQGNSLLESFEGVPLTFEWKRYRVRVIDGEKSIERNLFGEIVDPQMKMLDVMFSNTGGDLDIEAIERDYFDEHDPVRKEAVRRQVDDFERNFIRGELDKQEQVIRKTLKKQQGTMDGLQKIGKGKDLTGSREGKKVQALEAELTRLKAAKVKLAAIQPGEKPYFLWQLYFMDVFKQGGFDIVIGNPPYLQIQKLPEAAKAQLEAQGYKTFAKTADLYCLFYERGLGLLRPNGVLAFITSNKFFRAGYGNTLRELLNEQKHLQTIIDFGELPVFEAGTDPCILVVANQPPAGNSIRAAVVKQVSGIQNVHWTLEQIGFELERSSLSANGWTIDGVSGMALIGKIRSTGTPLGEYVKGRFYYGIKTGLNKAFVVDRATRDKLITEHPSSTKLLKPFVHGADVKKWRVDLRDDWLIYVPWHFPLHLDSSISGPSEAAEELFRTRFPAIYNHLLRYKPELLKRNVAETGIRYEWYALQRWGSEYWQEFDQPKILFNETSKELHACFDETGLFSNKTLFMIIAPQPKLLLAVLLSRTLDWFFRHEFPSWGDPWKGGRVQFRGDRMEKVPIPAATTAQQKEIEALVEQILALKKQNPDADVTALEGDIDQLVYKLYNLTKAEIAIVEGKA
jgi:type I restriction-modification system DNA methylase subunit